MEWEFTLGLGKCFEFRVIPNCQVGWNIYNLQRCARSSFALKGPPIQLIQSDQKLTSYRYDRLAGDSPANVMARVQPPSPFSFYQTDANITDTLQSDAIDQFVNQVAEVKSNAFLYLTVYPIEVNHCSFQLTSFEKGVRKSV